MFKKLLCLSLALVLVFSMTAAVYAEADKTIKIGILLPLSGKNAAFGEEARRGMEIALDEIAARGGIKGEYAISPIWCDVSTADAGMSEARRLIDMEKVPILSGTFTTDVAFAASTIAEQAKVIYWETCSPADALTERGYNYLFRVNPVAYAEGQSLAKFLYENAGMIGKDPADLKIAIVAVDSIYGTAIMDGAVERMSQYGLTPVSTEQYSASTTDLSPMIMKLRMSELDALIVGATLEDGILFYRQAYELGLESKVIVGTGSSFGSSLFYERFGNLAEYVLSGNFTIESSPEETAPGMRAFFEVYRERYNSEPILSSLSLGTYQSFLILEEALNNAADFTPDGIREAIMALDIPSGTMGNGWGAKFAPPGHKSQGTNLATDMVIVTQWQNGAIEQVWPVPSEGVELVLPLPTWQEREQAQ